MENKSQAEWENPWFINAEVYRKKILGEEKNYRLWKDFISNFKNEFDHLNFKDWPQEGPQTTDIFVSTGKNLKICL